MNGSEIAGVNTDTLFVDNTDIITNTYFCEANSSIVTDLTFWSETSLTPADQVTPIHNHEQGKSLLSIKSMRLDVTFHNDRIRFSVGHPEKVVLQMYNLQGREVMPPFTKKFSTGIHTFDLSRKLPGGIYVVHISGETRGFTTKLPIVDR